MAKVALALGYVSIKLTSPWNPLPIRTGDTRAFAAIARLRLGSSGFWLAERPFGFPLLYKLAGGSPFVLVWLQLLLGVGAWLFLAEALSRLPSSAWLSVLVCMLALSLALTSNVHAWDCILRSEGLGLSLLVLCVAAVVRFLLAREREPLVRRWGWVSLAGIAGVLAAFTRESFCYVLPILAGVSLAARWPRLAKARRVSSDLPALVLAGVLLLASFASQTNTRVSGRFAFPLSNVIFVRILPSRARLAYFVKRLGMPVTPTLQARAGKVPPHRNQAFMNLPEMKAFEAWVVQSGYQGYQRYLLSHFPSTARDALQAFGQFATRPMGTVAPSTARAMRVTRNSMTSLADGIWTGNPVASHPYFGWLALALVGLGGQLSRAPWARLPALLVLALLLAAASQSYVCFHGDAMEVPRHGLIVGVLLRLAVLPSVVLLLGAIPTVLRKLRARTPARVGG